MRPGSGRRKCWNRLQRLRRVVPQERVAVFGLGIELIVVLVVRQDHHHASKRPCRINLHMDTALADRRICDCLEP